MKVPANRPSVEFLRECLECRDGVLYWKTRPASHAAWRRSRRLGASGKTLMVLLEAGSRG